MNVALRFDAVSAFLYAFTKPRPRLGYLKLRFSWPAFASPSAIAIIADATNFGTPQMNQVTRNRIIVQAIRTWSVYAFATLLLVSLGSIWMEPSSPAIGQVLKNIRNLAPVAFVSLLLMPFLIREMVAKEIQITGPIRRLRSEIQKLREGQALRTLRLRDGDHWNGLAEDFNALVDQIHTERDQTADDSAPAIFSIKRAGG